MSEYWKSTAKKYCDYCKIYISDNKPSISIHESGTKHKENVQKKLGEIKKRAEEKKNADKAFNASMAAIEKAAQAAMEKDLESNPNLRKQYGTTRGANISVSNATNSSPPSSGPKTKPSVKKSDEKEKGVKRKSTDPPGSESKAGKWTTVEPIKPDSTKPVKVDLQLPVKQTITPAQKLEIGKQNLENEILRNYPTAVKSSETSEIGRIRKKFESEEPQPPLQPKWKAFGSSNEESEQMNEEKISYSNDTVSIKQEVEVDQGKTQIYDKEIAKEEFIVKKVEPIEEEDETVKTKEEKLAAKSLFQKKEKVVAFKKRNKETSNLRERLNDD